MGKALLQPPDFVVLCVHRDNRKAIALYKHFGFKFMPDGPDPIHKRMLAPSEVARRSWFSCLNELVPCHV